jgi:Methuselah N-terminus
MKIFCSVALMVAITGFQLVLADLHGSKKSSCHILDTVNVTAGRLDQFNNLHHNGMVYQRGTFEQYDYIIENGTEIKVPLHTRGCVCGIKPCIRLCCAVEEDNHELCISSSATLEVPTQDLDEEIDLTGKIYEVLVGRPCEKMYKLEPQDYSDDRWIFSVSPTTRNFHRSCCEKFSSRHNRCSIYFTSLHANLMCFEVLLLIPRQTRKNLFR